MVKFSVMYPTTPGARFDHVDPKSVVAIGVATALADKGNPASVRRPRWQHLVVTAGRQRGDRTRGQIQQIQVFALGAEIAGLVFLEVVAVDDDRRRRLVLAGCGTRILVADDQCHLLAVGGKGIVLDGAAEIEIASSVQRVFQH